MTELFFCECPQLLEDKRTDDIELSCFDCLQLLEDKRTDDIELSCCDCLQLEDKRKAAEIITIWGKSVKQKTEVISNHVKHLTSETRHDIPILTASSY